MILMFLIQRRRAVRYLYVTNARDAFSEIIIRKQLGLAGSTVPSTAAGSAPCRSRDMSEILAASNGQVLSESAENRPGMGTERSR